MRFLTLVSASLLIFSLRADISHPVNVTVAPPDLDSLMSELERGLPFRPRVKAGMGKFTKYITMASVICSAWEVNDALKFPRTFRSVLGSRICGGVFWAEFFNRMRVLGDSTIEEKVKNELLCVALIRYDSEVLAEIAGHRMHYGVMPRFSRWSLGFFLLNNWLQYPDCASIFSNSGAEQ
jgi:hypothetical protein